MKAPYVIETHKILTVVSSFGRHAFLGILFATFLVTPNGFANLCEDDLLKASTSVSSIHHLDPHTRSIFEDLADLMINLEEVDPTSPKAVTLKDSVAKKEKEVFDFLQSKNVSPEEMKMYRQIFKQILESRRGDTEKLASDDAEKERNARDGEKNIRFFSTVDEISLPYDILHVVPINSSRYVALIVKDKSLRMKIIPAFPWAKAPIVDFPNSESRYVIYDLDTRDVIYDFKKEGFPGSSQSIKSISPDGRYVIFEYEVSKKIYQVFDVQRQEIRHDLEQSGEFDVEKMFSPDMQYYARLSGKNIVVGRLDGTTPANTISFKSFYGLNPPGKEFTKEQGGKVFGGFSFSPDSKTFAIHLGGFIGVYHSQTGRFRQKISVPYLDYPRSNEKLPPFLVYDPTGRNIISFDGIVTSVMPTNASEPSFAQAGVPSLSGDGSTLYLYKNYELKERIRDAHQPSLKDYRLIRDSSRQVFKKFVDADVIVFDVKSLKQTGSFKVDMPFSIPELVVNHNGDYFSLTSAFSKGLTGNGFVTEIWSRDGRKVFSREMDDSGTDFSADGKTFSTWSYDSINDNAASGQHIYLGAHGYQLIKLKDNQVVIFLPDGRLIWHDRADRGGGSLVIGVAP